MAKRTFSDHSTTDFPKMGETIATDILNISGRSSRYTTSVPRKTEGRGASPTGKAAHRSASLIKEAHGPAFSVQGSLYHANAAEANMVLRNVKYLPASVPRRDRSDSQRTFGEARKRVGQKTP